MRSCVGATVLGYNGKNAKQMASLLYSKQQLLSSQAKSSKLYLARKKV